MLGVFIYDFVTPFSSTAVTGTVGTIYIAILSIFVGTKEFDRWFNAANGRHYGEVFVYLWTAVMVVFVVFAAVPGYTLRIPSAATAVYIAVLGIYAITGRSKALHQSTRLVKKR